MSSSIKILPQALSNKIAAGEVVNRPESVVKELMENSLDAGASEITLIIKDAGKALIQVIDNGGGMNEDDAVMSFQRHSTSKINSYEDLENILTLGFRGEALASICSISQVEMKTRTSSEDVGTQVRVDGNEITEVSKINTPVGTSIAVKNLFYNTPGRRNFLKSNQTEFKRIYETFIKLAVSNPDRKFTFINNDDTVFELESSALKKRIEDIFTHGFGDSLIEVDYGNSLVKVKGFVSKPTFTKKSKQDQYFYLNKRFFQSKSLNFAVYSGYDDLVEKGDYPSFFLFIELDPKKVDVNVHPSKMEVKFEDEGAVFGTIRNSIRDALKRSDLVFNVGFDNKMPFGGQEETFHYFNAPSDGNKSEINKTPVHSFKPERAAKTTIHSILDAGHYVEDKEEDVLSQPAEKQSNVFEHRPKDETERFNVWQFQNKYVMCQTETGFMIIDQHAAHERILYEKAVLWLESQSSFSQQLLIPLRVELTKIDLQIASSLKTEMESLGFNFNILKNGMIELTGVPSDIKIGNENKIMQELIDQYKEYELKLNLEKRDNLAKSFACRSAIKAGDKLTYKEMIGLIDDLFGSQMPYVCPHGRPTVIRITTDELDKRFSRT